MGLPPVEPGALKVMVACALPAVAVPIVGAPGTVNGVEVAVPLALPCPTTFTADTRKSYDSPLVNPVTVPVVFVEVPSAKTDHIVGSV